MADIRTVWLLPNSILTIV